MKVSTKSAKISIHKENVLLVRLFFVFIKKHGGERRKNMEQKKLCRSVSNRMVCGVCGGIGSYFNIDPTLVRLIWVIASFVGVGSGLLVYIIAAVIIPEEY